MRAGVKSGGRVLMLTQSIQTFMHLTSINNLIVQKLQPRLPDEKDVENTRLHQLYNQTVVEN